MVVAKRLVFNVRPYLSREKFFAQRLWISKKKNLRKHLKNKWIHVQIYFRSDEPRVPIYTTTYIYHAARFMRRYVGHDDRVSKGISREHHLERMRELYT